MIRINRHITIDPSEIVISFVRASGPGGQNVNKVSSAVQLRFDAINSPSLPDTVKERLRRIAGTRMTKDGVLIVMAQRFRTQERNRQDALNRLQSLLETAAQAPKTRRATKPTKASKERRLQSKARQSQAKSLRTRKADWD